MKTSDLTDFDDDGFVLHFGGRSSEVDARTFGVALVAIAEAIREINNAVNPGFAIEIAIDGVGPGSFRARIRTVKKSLKNLFSSGVPRDLIIGILSTLIYEKAIDREVPPEITINDDLVIIQHGDDRIIVTRDAYDIKQKVEENDEVNLQIARAMGALEEDPSVESFGLARNLHDPEPIIEFSRSTFATIRQNALPKPQQGKRHIDVDATISIHKAVFERSTRKWEFIWNGFKISAPILDQTFFDRLEAREIALQQGDAFNARLRIHQSFDKLGGNWLNERYEVIRVGDRVGRRADQLIVDFQSGDRPTNW